MFDFILIMCFIFSITQGKQTEYVQRALALLDGSISVRGGVIDVAASETDGAQGDQHPTTALAILRWV